MVLRSRSRGRRWKARWIRPPVLNDGPSEHTAPYQSDHSSELSKFITCWHPLEANLADPEHMHKSACAWLLDLAWQCQLQIDNIKFAQEFITLLRYAAVCVKAAYTPIPVHLHPAPGMRATYEQRMHERDSASSLPHSSICDSPCLELSLRPVLAPARNGLARMTLGHLAVVRAHTCHPPHWSQGSPARTSSRRRHRHLQRPRALRVPKPSNRRGKRQTSPGLHAHELV